MQANQVIAQSGISFGTSGARGLVEDFSPDVCAAFTLAFLEAIQGGFTFNRLAIAIDNRPSSYLMAQACAAVLKQFDIEAVYYGVIPTPALAYKAMLDGMPAIMVTGSHIPFDRNGLKFYRPDGEISKDDELAIVSSSANFTSIESLLEPLSADDSAAEAYIKRYSNLFSVDALKGKKIGIYEHSSAGRDIYKQLFELLGAEVMSLERTDIFVPIDTEAVSAVDQKKALDWSTVHRFDAIFSTDGDGDRPLIADENGRWLRGDVLGLLCSQLLKIEALAVPVSCNTAIEKSSSFKEILRTRIGSPYVIAEFQRLAVYDRVAGFEANGGYLLATDITIGNGILKALPTRDALLPALVVITQESTLSELVAGLPTRYTASDRLQNFDRANSLVLIENLKNDASDFLSELDYDGAYDLDITDGLRIILHTGDILHLRPSGNAPELRCYAESYLQEKATLIVRDTLSLITRLYN
ncbi:MULTISPECIES: phosphomannomutase [unclassified Pseudoalteromonas]|uniref:phosphomannomutase n=1 Tax=unclassified Pseudoalteromonas TaxID=194690 RepID=UPI0004028FCC|nr:MULTISPECIES: phosphomannomutase [unclassified Pseudoalteromonas]